MNESSAPRRWAWTALLVVFVLGAFAYSIIQPLGQGPDEREHAAYIKAIADNHRLPDWDPRRGGEAGYQTQHPPLYYTVMAAFYAITGFLAENWRWQLLRWLSLLLVGLPLFFVCRHFFCVLLSPREPCPTADGDDVQHGCLAEDGHLPLILTASVLLMPMTLFHLGTLNPHAAAMLLASLTLWLAWRMRECLPDRAQSVLVGLTAGLAVLTRLSALPILVVAVWAHFRPRGSGKGYQVAWQHLALTVAGFILTAGLWFGRNWWLYRTLMPHTRGPMGSGVRAAFTSSLWDFGWLTWRETFLGSFAPRGLFPGDFWSYLLYGLAIIMALGAIVGLIWRRRTPIDDGAEVRLRSAMNLSGALLLLVFLGQQWAYWTIDMRLNAGGSYILVAMVPLVLLLTAGIVKLLRQRALVALWVWLVVLIVMNLVSMWNILYGLNPRFTPGWHPFQLP